MIKTIIFDLGGVLVSLNKERCLNAFSNSLQFPNFGDYLNPYAQSGFFAKFENGDISSAEFRDIIRERSSAKELSDKQIDDALCAFLTDVDPKKVTMLLELKKKYRLLLLSNNNPIAWEGCKTLFKEASGGIAIDDVFDNLYLSYQMNLSKPGEAIFNELLIKEGILPHESLFIDDAPKNIETAKKLGFNVLLYNVEEDLCCKVAEILSND
jgi:putative hydrolase of the HAD superfamily